MQTHLFHVWIAQYWQYWLSEGNAVNIRTIAIKMVCAHIHKPIFPHQNENKLYLFGLMMLVSQSKSSFIEVFQCGIQVTLNFIYTLNEKVNDLTSTPVCLTLTSTVHELPDVGGGHYIVGSHVIC